MRLPCFGLLSYSAAHLERFSPCFNGVFKCLPFFLFSLAASTCALMISTFGDDDVTCAFFESVGLGAFSQTNLSNYIIQLSFCFRTSQSFSVWRAQRVLVRYPCLCSESSNISTGAPRMTYVRTATNDNANQY